MGSTMLPITLFFNLLNADALRFVHHRRFCTNAGFELVDHVTIIQTIFTNAILIETTFLVTAGHAQRGHQRFTRTVHHAADDGNVHRGDDVFQALLQSIHGANHVKLLT